MKTSLYDDMRKWYDSQDLRTQKRVRMAMIFGGIFLFFVLLAAL